MFQGPDSNPLVLTSYSQSPDRRVGYPHLAGDGPNYHFLNYVEQQERETVVGLAMAECQCACNTYNMAAW
jgi:hypothetical protein